MEDGGDSCRDVDHFPSLTGPTFQAAARGFSSAWARWLPEQPPWVWVPVSGGLAADHGGGYLELRDFPRRAPPSCAGGAAEGPAADEAEEAAAAPGSGELHLYCYQIVYSLAYRVPVIYFQGRTTGGAPLPAEAFLLGGADAVAGAGTSAAWGDPRALVTEEEHPLLPRPSCMLHPCQTDAAMRLLLAPGGAAAGAASPAGGLDGGLQYLAAWYSLASQPLALPRLPLQLWRRTE